MVLTDPLEPGYIDTFKLLEQERNVNGSDFRILEVIALVYISVMGAIVVGITILWGVMWRAKHQVKIDKLRKELA